MQKWDYKRVMVDRDSNQIYIDGVCVKRDKNVLPYLQALGNEGWELAGVTALAQGGGMSYGESFWLKRPIP